MPRSVAALLALLAVLCAATASGAPRQRVAVLRSDSELLRAITIALAPWGVDTTASDVDLPGSSQPEAVQTASRLAQQLQVEAVIWVTPAEQGSLLWVFDNRREVTTRALVESPPFDGAAAAAVALSVKTILRGSAVAPPQERRETPPTPVHSAYEAAGELGAGVRWLSEARLEPRLELAAVLWFKERRIGVDLEFSGGPGVAIEDSAYQGRYREFTAGAQLRLRLLEISRVSGFASLGSGAHFTTLDGHLSDGRSVTVNRLRGSLDARLLLLFRASRAWYLGAAVGGCYLPAYQRYLVEGRPVFSPWPVTATLTGYVGLELF